MSTVIKNLLKVSLPESTPCIAAIDPGETTGLCCFRGHTLDDVRQITTKNVANGAWDIRQWLHDRQPDMVVMEDYRVYSWKAKDHAWQALHTPKLIGALEYICMIDEFPLHLQMAQQAKGFCTDQKLKIWEVYNTGRHARDAIRHAIYYLLFEVAKVQVVQQSTGVAHEQE